MLSMVRWGHGGHGCAQGLWTHMAHTGQPLAAISWPLPLWCDEGVVWSCRLVIGCSPVARAACMFYLESVARGGHGAGTAARGLPTSPDEPVHTNLLKGENAGQVGVVLHSFHERKQTGVGWKLSIDVRVAKHHPRLREHLLQVFRRDTHAVGTTTNTGHTYWCIGTHSRCAREGEQETSQHGRGRKSPLHHVVENSRGSLRQPKHNGHSCRPADH